MVYGSRVETWRKIDIILGFWPFNLPRGTMGLKQTYMGFLNQLRHL
jgi:hypothetical protein